MSSNVAAVVTYLLLGIFLLGDSSRQLIRTSWPSSVWYVIMWLPTEFAILCSNWAANFYLSSVRMQDDFEDAVLQVLFAEGATSDECLKSNVAIAMCGEKLGSLTCWYLLRHLVRTGWVHKQMYEVADHYNYYRTETWYSLTESGIREVKERGLH